MSAVSPKQLAEQFQHIFEVISSEDFLKREALGGEVPFFISAYHPEVELEARKNINSLIQKLKNKSIEVLEIHLYSLCLEILENRGFLQKILDKEPGMDKDRFFKVIQGPLDIESRLIPTLEEKYKASNVQMVFITGVGEVFPYIRSHVILNNLQRVITDAPTILFFPGIYDGTKLELFGIMKDDNYYRAFQLNEYKRSKISS